MYGPWTIRLQVAVTYRDNADISSYLQLVKTPQDPLVIFGFKITAYRSPLEKFPILGKDYWIMGGLWED